MAIIKATAQNFDELVQADYVVVDFYGDHCGPCKYMAPFFHAASNDLPLIRFVKANTEVYPELSKRLGIQAIPTLHFYRNGELVHKVVGAVGRDVLDQYIAKMLYD